MTLHVPYSFVPGTKARAEEVNANFNSVLEYVDSKADNDLSNITSDGLNFIKNSVSIRNLGEIIPSLIPLRDAHLHLLDGSLLMGSGAYGEFVSYMQTLVELYPSIFTTEEDWQNSVETYGVCAKFVYNELYHTLRLPKFTGIIEGTNDVEELGDVVEAGLPNITGSIPTHIPWTSAGGTGALYSTSQSYNFVNGSNSQTIVNGIYVDASLSNSIYGKSSTVQPQTTKVFYYIVVSNSSKTDIQVDIDEIATDLNGKADVDLSNVSFAESIKSEIISWAMPDYANAITYANDTTVHTAPSDGYVCLSGRTNNGALTFYVNGVSLGWSWANSAYATGMSWFVPVSKDDTFYADNAYSTNVYKFFPMKGVS